MVRHLSLLFCVFTLAGCALGQHKGSLNPSREPNQSEDSGIAEIYYEDNPFSESKRLQDEMKRSNTAFVCVVKDAIFKFSFSDVYFRRGTPVSGHEYNTSLASERAEYDVERELVVNASLRTDRARLFGHGATLVSSTTDDFFMLPSSAWPDRNETAKIKHIYGDEKSQAAKIVVLSLGSKNWRLRPETDCLKSTDKEVFF